MREGWYQVLFERDLADGLTVVPSARPLVALRTRKSVRVFDATCPHRGAHLAYGGLPAGDEVICPFHHRRIGIGSDCGSGYAVREYPTLVVGGMVFACFASKPIESLPKFMMDLDRTHYYVPGFELAVDVPGEMVIENGFDATHFRPVHGVKNEPSLAVHVNASGDFMADGTFTVPASRWQRSAQESGLVAVPYQARAFGAGVLVSHMGGDDPYYVITSAMPTAPGKATARLSIAVPGGTSVPSAEGCDYLLRQMQAGLEKDQAVWRHLIIDAPANFEPEDASVVAFRQYLDTLSRFQ